MEEVTIDIGGGQIVRFPNADTAAEFMQAQAASTDTNMLEQSMSGVNEGLASLIGAPVDLMTGAVNLIPRGINAVAGTNIPLIENGFGGSGTVKDVMGGAISDVAPQTGAQRFGRRIGEEVGATVIPAARLARSAASLPRFVGLETASAVGAGTGAQVAQEIAPGSQGAELVGQLVGGITPSMATRTRPDAAPTAEQLTAGRDAGYEAVEQSQVRLTQEARDQLVNNIAARVRTDGLNPARNPKAASMVETINGLPANPTIAEVETMRQIIGRDVAGAREPSERLLGANMKGEVDTFLDNLTPTSVTGAGAEETVAALRSARQLAARIFKVQNLSGDTGAITRALRRAASTGTGGNEVNALRQNIRVILDSATKRRGFSAAEISAMEDVVNGTRGSNLMRFLGRRFAPSSGGLPALTGMGAMAATGSTGNPLFLAPSVLGQAAQAVSEGMTRGQVRRLDELVRRGGPTPVRELPTDARLALGGLLSAQAATSLEPDQ